MESLVMLRIISYVLCIIKAFFVLFGHGMAKYVQCIVDKLLQGNIHSQ